MKQQRKVFRASKIALAVAATLAAHGGLNLAMAGSGWGNNLDFNGNPIKVPTFYANSPSGLRTNQNPNQDAGTINTGTALRKFVDGLPGLGAANANNLGQYLPVAAADGVSYPGSDYYEIAVVEYTERMHTDLPKKTKLRGYVQLTKDAVNGKPLSYPAVGGVAGAPILIQDTDAAHNLLFNADGSPTMVPAYGLDNPHYLGPIVVAQKGRAVRVKFVNLLPVGSSVSTQDAAGNVVVTDRKGDLFLPVDTTLLGATTGPDGVTMYSQNRAEIHMHGGDTPWISDGTPHQWIAPLGEVNPGGADGGPTPNARGVSTRNVPDMPNPGEGAVTYYFPNNQSARLMFYHDHSSGLTRLNVYAGEAAGYVLQDDTEKQLTASGVLPSRMIPLVLQDKTFVPADYSEQDGRWNASAWGEAGDLWFPHVYETNQDPNSFDGTNPVGRWDYGPWFWPVFPVSLPMPTGVLGDVSTTPEAFMDTPVVNGTAYPTLNVDPGAYRFRVLNAGNDRFLNLGLYVADDTPAVVAAAGRPGTEVKMVPASAAASPLPACAPGAAAPTLGSGVAACWPDNWPNDGREGGVPDPATVGPDIVVIGNEGGFLPEAHVIPSSPIVYELNRRSITVLNVLTSGLYLGNAERADVVIDFSQYAGKTLILYNDAPAPVPAFDPRIDYYTGSPDQTGEGGAEGTKAGVGPNTRTFMQIKVAAKAPEPTFNVAALEAALPAAYAAGSDRPIIGQAGYNKAFGANYSDNYAKIRTGSGQQPDYIWTPTDVPQTLTTIDLTDPGLGYMQAPEVVLIGGYAPANALGAPLDYPAGFVPATATATLKMLGGKPNGQLAAVTVTTPGSGYTAAPRVAFISGTKGGIGATASVNTSLTQKRAVQNKAIQELFDVNYGRMNATLGVELPFSTSLVATTVPLGYIDPPTEFLVPGETQIWKITHNGVDTHPVHFHLMNVQLVNRVGWDGTIKAPTKSELGWKETIKMNPLEDIIVAISPKNPLVPFGVPDSVRVSDPTQKTEAALGAGQNPNNVPTTSVGFTQIDFNQTTPAGAVNLNFGLTVPAGTVRNNEQFYEWEYVWHCHILGHEENDFMRPVVFKFGSQASDAPIAPAVNAQTGEVKWTDPTPWPDLTNAGTLLSKKNEMAFRVERVKSDVAPAANAVYTPVGTTLANATSFTDATLVSDLANDANAVYWYRVTALSAKGGAAGSPSVSVRVPDVAGGAPTAPGVPVATQLVVMDANGDAANQVTVTWTAPDPVVANVVYVIKRCVVTAGVCGALTTLTTSTPAALIYVDTAVAPNTDYQYQVVAQTHSGASPAAVSLTVKTDSIAPKAPSALAVTPVSALAISLNWVDNSSAPNNEAGFVLQRRQFGAAGWTAFAPLLAGAATTTVAADVRSYVDSGLTENTIYQYQVAAVGAVGTSAYSPIIQGTTQYSSPAMGAVTATPGVNQVTLSWATPATPATTFEITRTGGTGAAVTVTVPVTPVSNTYVDNSVAQNTAYTYSVKAINGSNPAGTAVSQSAVTLLGAVPATALTAVAPGTSVTVGWKTLVATDNVTGVRVFRCEQTAANFNCTAPASQFTQVYSLDAAPTALNGGWIDTAVTPSTGYTYQAYFVNASIPTAPVAAVVNGATATASATVAQVATIAAPTAFTATLSTTQARVNLSWRDASTNETSFVIERSTDGGNTFSQVGTATASAGTGSTRSEFDATAAPGTIYVYRVKAVLSAAGSTSESGYAVSAPVDMSLPAPSGLTVVGGSPLTGTSVQLSWTDNSANETSFEVFRSADNGTTWVSAGTATAGAGTGTKTFTESALTLIPGATYKYYVVARWLLGTFNSPSAQSNVIDVTTANLPAPTAMTAAMATSVANAQQITLTWMDNAATESSYEVSRSVDGTTVVVGNVARTGTARTGTGVVSFVDTTGGLVYDAANPKTYTYSVRAVNVTGAAPAVYSATATTTLTYTVPLMPVAHAVAGAAGSIVISWDNVANESGYVIERQRLATVTDAALGTTAASAQSWSLYRTNAANTSSYTNTGLTAGRMYQYRVRATSVLGIDSPISTSEAVIVK